MNNSGFKILQLFSVAKLIDFRFLLLIGSCTLAVDKHKTLPCAKILKNHTEMNYILFDDSTWEQLLPLTFTRPVCEVRVGILTIREKWEKYLETKDLSYCTKSYLQAKFQMNVAADNMFINGSIIPSAEILSELDTLAQGEALADGEVIYAARLTAEQAQSFNPNDVAQLKVRQVISTTDRIEHLWNIFQYNGEMLERDFRILTKNRKSEKLSDTNRVIGNNDIFIERGAVVECAILNAKEGPIYIGKNSEVMEGAIIRGPFALCTNSVVKMAAKIYGPTTIGPNSKVGGELNNAVFFGNSNKAHDGFIGNAVIGEWCNLGADTNNSNLKNNYAEVKQWNYAADRFIKTGLQFCGLVMGDHSKAGINTMFNTGTVVGVAANVFGGGFPSVFIPSFSWGGAAGFDVCSVKAACDIAERVTARRHVEFTEIDKKMLADIFEMTAKYRQF